MCLVDHRDRQMDKSQSRQKVAALSESTELDSVTKARNSDEFADILTLTTQLTQRIYKYCVETVGNSPFTKIIFGTTQPVHLLVAITTASLAFIYYSNTDGEVTGGSASPLAVFIYLLAFTVHAGTQFWMTFVSGLALYFSLPRHHFGAVQRVLFPKYFLLNAALSLVTLLVFLRYNRNRLDETKTIVQIVTFMSCFLVESSIRIWLTAPLLKLMSEKNDMEAISGSGWEIGKYSLGNLAQCPKYIKTHKRFRKVHMLIAIGNVYTMACTVVHLHYLCIKNSIL